MSEKVYTIQELAKYFEKGEIPPEVAEYIREHWREIISALSTKETKKRKYGLSRKIGLTDWLPPYLAGDVVINSYVKDATNPEKLHTWSRHYENDILEYANNPLRTSFAKLALAHWYDLLNQNKKEIRAIYDKMSEEQKNWRSQVEPAYIASAIAKAFSVPAPAPMTQGEVIEKKEVVKEVIEKK